MRPISRLTEPGSDALSARHLYGHASALGPLALTILQHTPVATADLFAARALQGLAAGEVRTRPMVVFFACHAAPYLLAPAAAYAKSRWLTATSLHYEQASLRALQRRPDLWLQHRGDAHAMTHRVVNDVPWVVGMLVGLGSDGARLAVALSVQAVMLGVMVDPKLTAAFAMCCLIGCMTGLATAEFAKARKQITSLQGGDPHHRYGIQRERMWDNTTLGNQLNFDRWRESYAKESHAYAQDLLVLGGINAAASLAGQATAATLFGLQLLRAAQTLSQNDQHEALVSYFLPLTARAGWMLQQSEALGTWTTQMSHHLRILARLGAEMTSPAQLQPKDHISDKLSVIGPGGKLISAQALLDTLPTMGRYTVRGPNGAGKTMLMTALKEAGADGVFLWPATHDLMFGIAAGSTGQTARRALEVLHEDIKVYPRLRTIILDEWDANLDAANRQALSLDLDNLAQSVGIIEVTHAATQSEVLS